MFSPSLSLALALPPWLSVLACALLLLVGYVLVAAVGVRALRFRPGSLEPVDPTTLDEDSRKVMEAGHSQLERLGFRYAFCLLRQPSEAGLEALAEAYYFHSGFDAVAILSADEGRSRVVFRSYRSDGWCLETQPTSRRSGLPPQPSLESWTSTKTRSLSELLESHLARFKARAKGAAAVLPEPPQLLAAEQAQANSALTRLQAARLIEPVRGSVAGEHRHTWTASLSRARGLSPVALLGTLSDAGISLRRIVVTALLLALLVIAMGLGWSFRQAGLLLQQAQFEATAAGLPQSLLDVDNAVSATQRRTVKEGAWWWCRQPVGQNPEQALEALRLIPAAQLAAGAAAPASEPTDASPPAVIERLELAYQQLSTDLAAAATAEGDKAKAAERFNADAIAIAALLRDMHWSLRAPPSLSAVAFQERRRQRLLALLDALELHWQTEPPLGSEFTAQLLAALPAASELQRDAVAAYFTDKIAADATPDLAPPLARFLRDATPLGRVSLAGHLRAEVAQWQALNQRRAWTDAALLPSPEQEGNLISQLHQQPDLALRRAQLELLATYAPRRSLCTAAVATLLLMKQLPTPQLYTEPVTRALARLSGKSNAIELRSADSGSLTLQVTVPTVPPGLVSWRVK